MAYDHQMEANTISRKNKHWSHIGNRSSVLGDDTYIKRPLVWALTLLLQCMYSCKAILPGSASSTWAFVWNTSNLYPVSQAINQNSNLRNKAMLDLCDTCAGGNAAAVQTGHTVGPNVFLKALSCVDNFTSALKTEWDWMWIEALSASTSSLHFSPKKTNQMLELTALSWVNISTSAPKTKWDWMLIKALRASTSSLHLSPKKTQMMPI